MHSVTLLPKWGKRGKDRHFVFVKVLLFSEPLSTLKTIAFLKNLTSEWQLCFKYSTSTIGRRGISSFFTHLPSQKYTCWINTELYITFALSKVRANRHLMLGILEKKKKKKRDWKWVWVPEFVGIARANPHRTKNKSMICITVQIDKLEKIE